MTLTYPLSAALLDLEDYYRAGTLTSGLTGAVAGAAVNAQESGYLKLAAIREQAKNGVINDVRQPLRPQGRPHVQGSNRLTEEEENLPNAKIKQIQIALCVQSPIDDFGPLDLGPRQAMSEFFVGAGLARISHI